MTSSSNPVGRSIFEAIEGPRRSGWVEFLRDLVPGSTRRRIEKARRECLPYVLSEARRLHSVFGEFAVDPRSHHGIDMMAERIFSIACHAAPYDRLARELERIDDGHPLVEQARSAMAASDVHRLIDEARVDLRHRLEAEALQNILSLQNDPGNRARVVAGLTAALDEITMDDSIKAITRLLDAEKRNEIR